MADNLDVTLADTGREAVLQIEDRGNDFDCIILDYTLPDISGTDIVNKVAENKQKHTPVIIYSAKRFW